MLITILPIKIYDIIWRKVYHFEKNIDIYNNMKNIIRFVVLTVLQPSGYSKFSQVAYYFV